MRYSALLFFCTVSLIGAAQPTPTNLTVDGTGTLRLTSPDGADTFVFAVDLAGVAKTSAFGTGSLTGSGTLVAQPDGTLTTVGTFQVVFSTGNVVYGDISVPKSAVFDTSNIGQRLGFSGVIANINRGTGQFAGANGQFSNMSGYLIATSADQANNSAAFTFHFEGSGNITAPNFVVAPPAGLRFVPVAPCRVADTRLPNSPFGGPSMAGNTSRDFPLPSSTCGIPSGAAAYSLNVTVVPKGPLSYLTLWPTGQSQPLVSTLNSFDARIKANAAIVPAGLNGAVSVYVTNPADVVLDINGYFEPATATNLAFYPVPPCRISDTRVANGPILQPGETRTVAVLASACGIPAAAKAYSLNMTAVPVVRLGYLTTWPAGQAQPFVSTLNAPTGTVVANAAIVPAGTGGSINVFVTDQTHLVVDINGYFAPPGAGGLLFYPASPCRMVDTRNTPAGLFSAPSLTGTRSFPLLTSACNPPTSAQAYSMNVTVVPGPAGLPYLSLWPVGQNQPVVSTLNAFDGAITSNAAIVPAGNGGAVYALAPATTDVIFDLNGYFAP